MAKRIGTLNRISANVKHARSNTTEQKFLIASEHSEDHIEKRTSINFGDLAAVAIVYANTAQAALGRYRKQFPKDNKHLDIVAIEYPSAPANKILKASVKVMNDNLQKDEEATSVQAIELMYAEFNGMYKVRKLNQEKKRRQRIAAKKHEKQLKVVGETLFSDSASIVDEYVETATASAKKAGVRMSREKSTTVRSKSKAIKTAKKAIAAKKRVPAKTKKKASKKVNKKKAVSKKKK